MQKIDMGIAIVCMVNNTALGGLHQNHEIAKVGADSALSTSPAENQRLTNFDRPYSEENNNLTNDTCLFQPTNGSDVNDIAFLR